MISEIIYIEICCITIIFLVSLYSDLKYRIIPNKNIKRFLFLCLLLNFIEFLLVYDNITLVLIWKISFACLIFLVSLLLFSLKIIGGSDGKLMILVFLIHPVKFLNLNFVISFFLLLSLLFCSCFFFNLLYNSFFNNSISFEILFAINQNISTLKQIYLKIFCNFTILAKIYNFEDNKKIMIYSYIIYNIYRNRFQSLVQYRIPFVLIIMFSYYLVIFLNLGI